MKLNLKLKPVHPELGTIYRKGAVKGQFLFMRFEVEGSKYRCITGVTGGKEKVAAWVQAKAKNVGRANETSAKQQALIEAANKRAKQLRRRGYAESLEDVFVDKSPCMSVMLANTYRKGTSLARKVWSLGSWIIQPKLNGIRCVINKRKGKIRAWTRNKDEIFCIPHILGDPGVVEFFNNFEDAELDGELYNHELRERLDTINSLVRKKKPTAKDLELSRALIQFHHYDVKLPNDSMTYKEREHIRHDFLNTSRFIKPVSSRVVLNEEQLIEAYHRYLRLGYEGGMMKLTTAVYTHKKCNFILKVKPRYTDEFVVVSVSDGKGKRVGMLARIEAVCPANKVVEGGWKVRKGTTFTVNVKGTDKWKRDMWAIRDKLKGLSLTVSYAYITTEKGRPFHNYLEKIHFKKKI